MTREQFLGFMESNFELNHISINLLQSIYDYANENNHCIHNYILEGLLRDAFSDDISEDEYKLICNLE